MVLGVPVMLSRSDAPMHKGLSCYYPVIIMCNSLGVRGRVMTS